MIWSQYKKKVMLILGALVFLAVVFLIKNDFLRSKVATLTQIGNKDGLTYDNRTFEELVRQDTDQDGVLDWQENLWGTDPTKGETTPGTPDSLAIQNLQKQQAGTKNYSDDKGEVLTETEKFSRDLFNTVAAASEAGQVMDQNTVDQITDSLNNAIENAPQRKVFTLVDIKITKDESIASVQKYADTLNSIYYVESPVKYTVIEVLQKFMGDGENINVSALKDLDPIIAFTSKTLNKVLLTSTPKYLASAHLNTLNNLEKVLENLTDMKLFETDIIVALSGISNYADNTSTLQVSLENLSDLIAEKLNN